MRLALEDVGAAYVDVARDGAAGMRALLRLLDDEGLARPPFAPPVLKSGKLVLAQTANILMFLGSRHGLAPKSETGRLWVHQLQLTLADFVVEIHDVHHPISVNRYYADQREEAMRRAADFRQSRAPKYLDYFERVLARNRSAGGHLAGARRTYADLSLFQVVDGLHYAFPRMMARLGRRCPRIHALHGRIAARPRLRAYCASGRRIPFNEDGIFRHYPELDG